MFNFIEHHVFVGEYKKFNSKYFIDKSFKSLKLILEKQFNPESPQLIIGPGKIHRVTVCSSCDIWKVEMAVFGLKSNQSPRIWFAISGTRLAFLTIKTHIDNYLDNEVNKLAESLSSDIF